MGKSTAKGGALKHIEAAERAYARDSCLVAGQAIDKAYVALGRRRSARLARRLKKVDDRFEKHCVRKHPK